MKLSFRSNSSLKRISSKISLNQVVEFYHLVLPTLHINFDSKDAIVTQFVLVYFDTISKSSFGDKCRSQGVDS